VIRGDGRAMPTGTKLDRAESRRDRRYLTPNFDIIVECELFHSIDWSIGGVHLDGLCERVGVGAPVEGWIGLPETPQAYAFSGRVLRTDAATGYTVVRFDDIDPEAVGFLDRAIARRLH
jgi:hypothetical protein